MRGSALISRAAGSLDARPSYVFMVSLCIGLGCGNTRDTGPQGAARWVDR